MEEKKQGRRSRKSKRPKPSKIEQEEPINVGSLPAGMGPIEATTALPDHPTTRIIKQAAIQKVQRQYGNSVAQQLLASRERDLRRGPRSNSPESISQAPQTVQRKLPPETDWEQKNPSGQITKTSEGFRLWNFTVEKADLKNEFEKALMAENWPIHRLDPTFSIRVEGHTSRSGADKLNQKLSFRRAAKVASFLWAKCDVPWELITIKGYGENKPLVPELSPRFMAMNRRVEVKILHNLPKPKPKEPKEPKKPKGTSNHFSLKVIGGSGGSPIFIPIGAEQIFIQIRDTENNLQSMYLYSAFSAGIGLPISITTPSSWVPIKTAKPIALNDFEGSAEHTFTGVVIGKGQAIESYVFNGPLDKKGVSPITVEMPIEQTGLGTPSGSKGTLKALFPPIPYGPPKR